MIQIGQNPVETAIGSSRFVPDADASGTGSYLRGGRRALRDRLRTMFVTAQEGRWGAFRTKETELASYGIRWDEAHLDRLLALELREHRAARQQRLSDDM